MKTLLLILTLSLTVTVSASEFIEGKHYVKINHCPNAGPQRAVHFFSFYCTQCFFLNQFLKNVEGINVSPDRLEKCHITSGPLGEFLSKAWVVAKHLGVADKVDTLIFNGIQHQMISDESSIKDIFLKVGVSSDVFDNCINHPEIVSTVNQQNSHIRKLGFYTIPALVVGNQFMVNLSELPWHDRSSFGEQYSQLINELLLKSTS